ncbi:MAG: hypothetical protein AAB372_02565 [Patescibacteria group bacterium]
MPQVTLTELARNELGRVLPSSAQELIAMDIFNLPLDPTPELVGRLAEPGHYSLPVDNNWLIHYVIKPDGNLIVLSIFQGAEHTLH